VRRCVVGVVVALLVAGVAGCGGDGSSGEGGDRPSALAFTPVTAGVLTVQTSLPAPGFWNGADPGSLTGGLEYELARRMARDLGLALRVDNVDFGRLVAGETTGFDLALSQITRTPDREAVARYSEGYFGSDQGVLVNRGTPVGTLEQAKDLQWGVQEGTTSESFLVGTIQPRTPPRTYAETPDLFAALLARDVDAVLFDTVSVLRQSNEPGYEGTEVVGQFLTGEVYGALLPLETRNLATVDTLISRYERSGFVDRLADRYLVPPPSTGIGGDPTKVPAIPY
jgi:polar amino acid transport system substrate-binding protein